LRRLLHVLFVLAIFIPAPSPAQNGANVSKSPVLTVIGAYSFSADKTAYARFIREKVDSHDPTNFGDDVRALLRKAGRGDEIRPLTNDDRLELEDHLRRNMHDAAVFEVLVTNSDSRLQIADFMQADPSQPKERWQVAWGETFLTADGEAVIDINYKQTAEQYRVIFVIHFWKPGLPLRSSYGELFSSPLQPLPERLWRLAPYDVPIAHRFILAAPILGSSRGNSRHGAGWRA